MQNVYNTIENDTKFHYRRLSKYPSKSATIRYSFTCRISEPRTRMELYTRDDHLNMQNNCSLVHFEQLLNDKLYVAAFDNVLEESPCRINTDHRICEGTKRIQDYIPRHYYFSFGIDCDHNGSLQGLSYNISILEQSNDTKCSPMHRESMCMEYYSYTSMPNLIGTDNIKDAKAHMDTGMGYISFIENNFGRKPCYQHYQEVICYLLLPECDTSVNSTMLIPPCKEACSEMFTACHEDMAFAFDILSQRDSHLSRVKTMLNMHAQKLSELVGCNYLPSVEESIPCFYKPVFCDNPKNITNAVIMNYNRSKIGFNLPSEIEYSCVNNTQMKGKNKRTCLYSGEWSEGPQCVNKSTSSPLKIVLPLLTVPFVIFIVLSILMKCRNNQSPSLYLRQKEYDAFVCYCYEGGDSNFAENTIRIHLEENLDFKLCIHRRDFLAAWDIKWNIMNAIRNSNSAIIVMSQDYVNSLWCVEEFEDFYMEHMKDPAFKLFVIMMQPAETMKITNEYINCFLAKSTYLEREDPKLFKKISDYLIWVKHPKKGMNPDETVQLPDTDENCTEVMPLQQELQIEELILECQGSSTTSLLSTSSSSLVSGLSSQSDLTIKGEMVHYENI